MNQPQLLKVEGWSNPRYSRVQDDRILFEVMWLGCACQTCISRLDAIKNRMESADVKSWQEVQVEIPQRFPFPSIALVVEPKEMPVRIDDYLGDLLGLRISAC